MRIYCMSDIHGCLEPFLKALETVDMESEDSMLVLLGDYCDRGPDSLGVFRTVMGLQERYGERVIALRGNHEEQLLEYMSNVDNPDFAQAWKLADSNLATARSFLEPDEFEHMRHLLVLKRFEEAYRYTVGRIRKSHGDVIRWVGRLPYYWESPFGQVFVHAGIDEEAADLWRVGTPPEWFTAMLPMYAGEHFDLDVIAGHVSTETVSGIAGYRGGLVRRREPLLCRLKRHGARRGRGAGLRLGDRQVLWAGARLTKMDLVGRYPRETVKYWICRGGTGLVPPRFVSDNDGSGRP